MASIKDKNLVSAAGEHLIMSRLLSKNVEIDKFVESNIKEHSISKRLQKLYLNKIRDGSLQIVTPEIGLFAKTLFSTYHKIRDLAIVLTLCIGSIL